MIVIKVADDANTFSLRVHPRAKKNAITGTRGDSLKLCLTAPAMDSKANNAVIDFFAEVLRVPRTSITIAAGQASRNKVIKVMSPNVKSLRERLEQLHIGERH